MLFNRAQRYFMKATTPCVIAYRYVRIRRLVRFYANPAAHIALINATPRQLDSMFSVNPQLDVQTLLSHACESLASANVMAMDLADHMEGTRRNSLLGIAQVIMLGELAVNQALDKLDAAE
jgi:hypothetical protein